MKIFILIVFFVLFAWMIWSYFISNVETLKYSVLEKRKDYEIRLYEPYIAMQVQVEGDGREALSNGFRILAGYIFGGNTSSQKIAMTKPVLENENNFEKVAMTAPVLEQKNGEKRFITFTAPSKYTLETLPKPKDNNIIFNQIPSKKYAAHRFSWYFTTQKIESKKIFLKDLLIKDNIKTIGEPMFAGYSGPGTIPFMIRNEILIEIE